MSITCPKCQSEHIVKNGHTRSSGKQNHKCCDCGRQFVLNPQAKIISQESRDLVDRLLLERLSLRGIARAVGVSFKWVQQYVNAKSEEVKQEVAPEALPKKGGPIRQ